VGLFTMDTLRQESCKRRPLIPSLFCDGGVAISPWQSDRIVKKMRAILQIPLRLSIMERMLRRLYCTTVLQ
jgi:hypothetical protein